MRSLLSTYRTSIALAMSAAVLAAGLQLWAPALVAAAIDGPIAEGDLAGLARYAGILLAVAAAAFVAQGSQVYRLGGVGQRVVFDLRKALFDKLLTLPVGFFTTEQTGDLISRLANDSEKLAQFFSMSLSRFVGSLVTTVGAGLCLLGVNLKLGAVALAPALLMLIGTGILAPKLRSLNRTSLEAGGQLSARVTEGLEQFRVVVAFDRRDLLVEDLERASATQFEAAKSAGYRNALLAPFYTFCSQCGQLLVLGYGLVLMAQDELTVGLLIAAMAYLSRFYDPLRQLAALWATLQAALSAYDRLQELLAREERLEVVSRPSEPAPGDAPLLEFDQVSFAYRPDEPVLHRISLRFRPGRTYALVGPTGGGKTTMASLMARLFDPTEGQVRFRGLPLQSLTAEERSQKIGYILQEPKLLGETVGENVSALPEEVAHLFPDGLATESDGLSAGQRQVVAFVRAVERQPELLILDEATANVDPATERLLELLLDRLPPTATTVVIAHRLQTVERAHRILFVNNGRTLEPEGLDAALELFRQDTRRS